MGKKTSSPDTARRKGKSRAAVPARSKKSGGSLSEGASPEKSSSGSAKLLTSSLRVLIIFGLAAVAGIVIMYQATMDGIGVTTDSIVYIKVARNLLSGHGFALSAGTPLTHYPPAYPATLAFSGIFANDLMTGIRWLHLFLYVANVLLVGLLVYRGTEGSLIAAIAGLLFMLTSGLVFYSHVVALSEVLFVFFVLIGILLITEYLGRNQILILVAASIVFMLAGMTRYVGFILLGMISLSILILHESTLKKRIINAGIVTVIFASPMLLWILRNKLRSNNIMNRPLMYHPIKVNQVEGAVQTISSWFFIPTNSYFIIKVSLLLMIISILSIILFKLIKRYGIHSHLNRVPLVCILFLVLYIAGLVFAIFFVEANLPFSHRILFPFFAVLGVLMIALGRNAFHLVRKPKWYSVLAVMLLGVFLVAQGKTMANELRIFTENGEGFSGKKWKASRVMEFIKALPDHATIYSNGPEAIEFLAGRQTKMIPTKRNIASNEENTRFSEGLGEMMRDLEHSRGYLVYFDLIAWRGYIPGVEELKPYGQLNSVYQARDGTVYQAAKLDH